MRVKEETVEMGLRSFKRGRLAGTKLLVNLKKSLFSVLCRILLESGHDSLIGAEEIEDFLVGTETESADESGDVEFSVLVYTDIEEIVLVRLILKPCAAVRDDGGGKELLTGLVVSHVEVYTRGTDELRNDCALSAVDYECSALCHEGEVTHIDVGLLNLTRLLVVESYLYTKGCGISRVSLLTLFDRILGSFIHLVIDELKHEVSGVIRNFVDVSEDFLQTDVEEPLI